MSEQQAQPTKTRFIGMPGYGRMTAMASRGLWYGCRNPLEVVVKYQRGSLLAANFNLLWATALNYVREGTPLKYFAMLHDDVGPADWWLDTLIAEMEATNCDIMGAVIALKDNKGLTTTALARPDGDPWRVQARLTMAEIFHLPETFTSDDVGGYPLLLNTGCWVCKFDPAWNKKVHFTVNDRIGFDEEKQQYMVQVEPEDWNFSRQLHALGLRVGATRKVPIAHEGPMEFGNDIPWGDWAYDKAFVTESVLDARKTHQAAARPVLTSET